MTIEELTVDQIQRQRGVSRRYAYEVLHQQREEEYTANPPSNNQRERILTLLYKSAGDIRNTNELLAALHADGYKIDGHDVTKTMWSLQKTGHVKFRERQKPRFLFAIKLTDLGESYAHRILEEKAERLQGEIAETQDQIDDAHQEQAFVAQAIADAELDEVEGVRTAKPSEIVPFDNTTATTHEDGSITQNTSVGFDTTIPVEATVSVYAFISDGYPTIAAVRDRARKAKKLAAAAAILEEEGEDEMALALMSKTEFTPLEHEIIAFLDDLDKKETE